MRNDDGTLATAGLAVAFLLLATLNAGGYGYGLSDQAFYIPAILRHLDPALFPGDRALIDSQSRLLVFDELAASVVAAGVPLPGLFAAAFVVAGVGLGCAYWTLARGMSLSWWGATAYVLAMTLRHRVAGTGVNTFERYFHPRMLAFALGIGSIGAVLASRWTRAVLLVALAACFHPTTALWFATWIGLARLVSFSWHPGSGAARPALALATIALGAVVLWLVRGAILDGLTRMDATWLSAFAAKDYVFPTAWRAGTWVLHGVTVALVGAGYLGRRREGSTVPMERAVVVGCLGLVGLFVLSLPFIGARVALAVQLQTSRLLWPVEALATLYLVWFLADAGKGAGAPWPHGSNGTRRALVVALALGIAALGRGTYVGLFEQNRRALVSVQLPGSPWSEALAWTRDHTPPGAGILADPGHAWKYGVSVRVGAARDVFLEETKDTAIALYSREIAGRVLERIGALGPFDRLQAEQARALAERFNLHYLIRDRRGGPLASDPGVPFPVAWANEAFVIQSLRPDGSGIASTPGPRP